MKLAYHDLTGGKMATKIMDKDVLGEHLPRVRLEMGAMQELCHQHVCKLHQIIETDNRFYMIMEDGLAQHLTTPCGSPAYAAPELICGDECRASETDPICRITVSQLLNHPWLNYKFTAPLEWTSKYKTLVDEDYLRELAVYFVRTRSQVENLLTKWRYDYLTATYFLLLEKKMKGQPV